MAVGHSACQRQLYTTDENGFVISCSELVASGMEEVKPEDINQKFGLVSGEKLFYCPYQRSHQIIKEKFAQHLVKCRHNYLKALANGKPTIKMVCCPYVPALHHMPELDMLNHRMFCPNRNEQLEVLHGFKGCKTATPKTGILGGKLMTAHGRRTICKEMAEIGERINSTVDSSKNVEEEDEEWEPGPLEGYDPWPKVQQNFYFRNPQGLTKSERREFRESETKKFLDYAHQKEGGE